MIRIKSKIDEIEDKEQPEIVNQKNLMKNDVMSMMDTLTTDLHEFVCFCYELRKQDDSDDQYSNFFLDNLHINGLPFKKTLLYEIIMSNKWNSQS